MTSICKSFHTKGKARVGGVGNKIWHLKQKNKKSELNKSHVKLKIQLEQIQPSVHLIIPNEHIKKEHTTNKQKESEERKIQRGNH